MRKLVASTAMCAASIITAVYKWAAAIDHNDIHHWCDNFCVVLSSNNKIASSAWLNIYLARQWLTIDDFLVWLHSCWIVAPLESCTCPVGMKVYSCKHSVGLAIKFNLFQVSDQTHIQPLGKKKQEDVLRKLAQLSVVNRY